jgi:hypothetical protein
MFYFTTTFFYNVTNIKCAFKCGYCRPSSVVGLEVVITTEKCKFLYRLR